MFVFFSLLLVKIFYSFYEDYVEKFQFYLKKNLQFLTKLHLMDYSMLVGIHDCAQAEEEALLNENANRDAAAGRETSESEECESGEK